MKMWAVHGALERWERIWVHMEGVWGRESWDARLRRAVGGEGGSVMSGGSANERRRRHFGGVSERRAVRDLEDLGVGGGAVTRRFVERKVVTWVSGVWTDMVVGGGGVRGVRDMDVGGGGGRSFKGMIDDVLSKQRREVRACTRMGG